MNKAAQLIARYVLGVVFIYASIDKIALPNEFAKIVADYDILPYEIGLAFANLLPWFELIFGIFLIVGFFTRLSAAIISMLLIVFIAAIILKSLEGNIENCGCFSSTDGGTVSPILLILRDVLLLFFGYYIIKFNKSVPKLSSNG